MSRLRADNLTNRAATGAPLFTHGASVTGVVTATSFDGNISGTTGTFSGDVSIGGTLTYEDVTNVDSVGMITARKGIQVLADGINAVGVVTATSFSGDGSNLSGVESGVANFVATGTISNGDTIVVNTDGTVSAITGSGSPESIFGSETTFQSTTTTYTSTAYIPGTSKVVVAYQDASNNNGKAVVGTVSGNSISFGTPVNFDPGVVCSYVNCVYDATNNKVVIVWNRASANIRSIVGTVSGTTITFGTDELIYGGNAQYVRAINVGGQVVMAMETGTGLTYVGTVSGTGNSITWATQVVFQSGSVGEIALAYDSDEQKVVYMYAPGSGTVTRAIAGTLAGGTISFIGSPYKIRGNFINDPSAVYDPITKKIVLCFQTDGFSSDTDSVAMTIDVSGTIINAGNETRFGGGTGAYYNVMYNSADNTIVICYNRDYGGGMIAIARVVGNDVIVNTPVTFTNTVNALEMSAAYDSTNNKVIVAYQDTTNLYGDGRVLQSYGATTNLKSENYIGIAAEAISGGATGKINIVGGINSGQSSLTPGKKYYVQIDGSLATTPTDPVVVAGTSVGATKIIVKG